MEWRRFRLLNERELALASDAVRRTLDTWMETWTHAPKPSEARCVVASEARKTMLFRDSDHWLGAGDAEGPLAWVCVPDASRADLARNLFGERMRQREERSELLPAVADAALRSLIGLLVAESSEATADRPPDSGSEPAREIWSRGSGAVVFEQRIGDVAFGLVLAEAWMRRVLAPFKQTHRRLPPLADPRLGLESCRVRVAVWAGSAEVELGVLQTLAPGDVVKMDLAIDEPMRLSVEDQDTAPRVFLGRVGGRKAVQLVPPQ